MLKKINPTILGFLFLAVLVAIVFGRYLYQTPRYVNGEQAPELVSVNDKGDSMRLSALRGKYVLLEFWGSWCGPCISEMPNVKVLYETYNKATFKNATGFEVVTVGIERDKQRWEKASSALGMTWPYNLCDFQYFDSPAAKQYGVRVIPAHFLLSPDGHIIGVNQTMEEIEKMLKEG